ncbi:MULTISPECIES: CPBP family intramembrane glutamic endopeptidase [Metallosphaera]|nr:MULTISPECIES: CPBP family intramembrane glutamic endopeptidase [Metallosphaera]MCY0861440.1 CPBP family intramembrane metalloprotease [Metallosphaera prunae]WPX07132.1 CPBP family intramembrane glutamic endopeptidase [Metallosphaera sedula DSM 5348]
MFSFSSENGVKKKSRDEVGMRVSSIFAGLVLPLAVIPWELLAYSFSRSLYAGAIVVVIGEMVGLYVARLITRRKANLRINKGMTLSIPVILLMIAFPPPLPIGFRYPLLVTPAVIGGICEELIYRDYILETGKYDNYIQAFLWSLNHALDGPVFVAYTFILGIFLGIISKRFGVFPCIIAHVSSNVLRLFL